MADTSGIVIVISGFSGAGKGTLMKRLITEYSQYSLSISMTTREPRNGEVDGREYFFTTDEAFERMIGEGKLIEHAGYCGHYYGTPKDFVEKKLAEGKDVLLEIDVQGALQVREIYPDAVLVFVTAPSIAELKKRLEKRGTESPEVIRKRLLQAKKEAPYIDRYDHLLVNDNIDASTKRMHEIIQSVHTAPARN